MKTHRQILIRLAISAAVSFIAMALIFEVVSRESGQVSRTLILNAMAHVSIWAAGLYFIGQLLQALVRAARYRILLKGGGEKDIPGLPHIFLVSMARNMFIDLLPSRVGELSYLAMLNRGYRVSGEACLSSLSVSVLFDFLALLLVVLGIIAAPVLGQSGRGPLIGATVVLAAAVVVGWLVLFRGFAALARWLSRRFARAVRLVGFLDRFARSLGRIRSSGVLAAAVALSAAVRALKYAGLYVLFVGVTRATWPAIADAPVWAVLAALIAAEGAASLPVPAFMSFGTYEAGGLLALTALGFPAQDSATAMTAMHVFSQAIDYTLGGLALVGFTFLAGRRGAEQAPSRSRARGAGVMAAVVLLGASVVFLGLEARQLGKMGALRPPGKGEPVAPSREDERALREAVKGLRGFMVWSSNRFGNHDIVQLALPGLKLKRLTTHPNVDHYPRISPDGGRVVFCRSQIEWGSQRDPLPWDVYVVDLKTGRESLVARNANTPTWSEDGTRVYFQRNRIQFVEHDLATGAERVLFESGKGQVPANCELQTPDFNSRQGRLAVTLRGGKRATAIFGLDGFHQRGPGGCELFWSPDGTYLYYANRGKAPVDGIRRYDPHTKESEMWVDLAPRFKNEYFPRVANDGRRLVFGASTGGHEHDTSDYEIFLWTIGEPVDNVARVTFHTGNDTWPDLWIERGR